MNYVHSVDGPIRVLWHCVATGVQGLVDISVKRRPVYINNHED